MLSQGGLHLPRSLFILLFIAYLAMHRCHSLPIPYPSRQPSPGLLEPSPQPLLLDRISSSGITPRIVSAVAAVPLLFAMLSHVFRSVGRDNQSMPSIRVSIYFLILSKAIAISLGVLTVLFGVVIGDLDVSLVGVASLGLVYAGSLASWSAVHHLYTLIRWMPNIFELETWPVNGRNEPVVSQVQKDKGDQYDRMSVAFRILVSKASQGDPGDYHLSWTDQIVLALLSTKFVSLTDAELDCENRWAVRNGYGGRTLQRYLLPTPDQGWRLDRWTMEWNGQPGLWLRGWNNFQANAAPTEAPVAEPTPSDELIHLTLRFCVVIFECIRRSKLRSAREQMAMLERVLTTRRSRVQQNRDNEGEVVVDMEWFFDVVYSCLDDRANKKLEGRLRPRTH